MSSLAAFRRKPAVQDASTLRMSKISKLYSRLSLDSLATQLKVKDAQAAELLCCEMIQDGRLNARIDQQTQSIQFIDDTTTSNASDNFDKSIQQLCSRIMYAVDRIQATQ
jgi:hypothetical protein